MLVILGSHCFVDVSSKIHGLFCNLRYEFFEISDSIRQYFANIGHNFSQDIGKKLFELQTENLKLKLENDRIGTLIDENNQLKIMLKMKESTRENVIFAKVINIFSNDFVRSALINVGESHGIKPDDFAYNENGLVGRVIEVSNKYSKVLLITDTNSNIPAKIAGIDAMLCGDNSDLLKVKLLSEDVKEGDTAETSSYGGVFPEKILIGKVVKEKGDFFVKTSVDFNKLKHVCISRCESQ